MRLHLDVLGWLYICCGAFAVLTGASLLVLASGTSVALADLDEAGTAASPTVWLLVTSGITFVASGTVMGIVGRALVQRGRFGRSAALVLAAPSLLVIPFGTALGVYTLWTLLNDEARREFGRPPRSPGTDVVERL